MISKNWLSPGISHRGTKNPVSGPQAAIRPTCGCQAPLCWLAFLAMKYFFAAALASLLCLCPAQAGLVEIENQFRAAYELGVGTKHAAAVSDLDGKYAGALERAMQESTKAGKLEEALALKQELERVTGKQPLPEADEGADAAVAKFRGIYRGQLGKLSADRDQAAAPILEKFGAALAAHQGELAKEGKLEDALAVKDYVAAGLFEKLTGEAVAVNAATAAPDKPFENSLGMKFVPVPIVGGPTAGKTIRFCIWETRVQDYEEFVEDTKTEWPKPDFKQGPDHPAVMMSWEDATAFCAWLTKEERRKRKIGPNDTYRLPSDHEWSCAVGIGKEEDASLAPKAKSGKVAGYPWGKEFPPTAKVGNYNGEETARNPISGQKPIQGYHDGFDRTAPVGSFPANAFGLFDLGGNVWEWCQEWYDPSVADMRVLRPGSWLNGASRSLLSSHRGLGVPSKRDDNSGFRCVLEVGSGG